MTTYTIRIVRQGEANIDLEYDDSSNEVTFDTLGLGMSQVSNLMDLIKKATGLMSTEGWQQIQIS